MTQSSLLTRPVPALDRLEGIAPFPEPVVVTAGLPTAIRAALAALSTGTEVGA